MKLDEEQQAKALAFVEKKTDDRCRECGSSDLVIQDRVFALPSWAGMFGVQQGGPSVPVIVVVCRACGRVTMFSAVHVGLLEEDDG